MDALLMWVVTLDPSDFPGKAVARCWAVTRVAEPSTSTEEPALFVRDSLFALRRVLLRRGLYRMPRETMDAPKIVEVWL